MNKPSRRVLHNSPLNIGIIGLGAIGCLLSSQMPKHYTIFALPSSPHLKNVHFQLDEGEQSQQYSIPTWHNERLDVVILCCKATQCLAAMTLWQHAINEHCQIVLLQNGMGQHEIIAEKFPNHTIFAASTTEGAYRKTHPENKTNQHIVHAGQGLTQWGYYCGPKAAAIKPSHLTKLKLDISQLQGQHQWHNKIAEVLFAKLALNAVINPLTVKHDCKNGELISHQTRIKELEELCEETEKLFALMQWPLINNLTEKVKYVAKLTANNVSSMLQDRQAGRATEIEFINGYLINKARAINYPLPRHEELFEYIKSL